MQYDDDILEAIGAWQRGWREEPDRKEVAIGQLVSVLDRVPGFSRKCGELCFRKRFMYRNDLPALVLNGQINDGIASWTTDLTYARTFKGFWREDGSFAALFRHKPAPREVLLNIPSLWQDADFKVAAERFRTRRGPNAEALFNFASRQGEIILAASLNADEAIGFTGKSSPFESLVQRAGIYDADAQDQAYKALIDNKIQPELPDWIDEEATQRVLKRTRAEFARISKAQQ